MGVKLTVYGSPLCGDCVETERVFQERGIEYEFVNITESIANLKAFLAFRDQDERFADIRGLGRVGIPFFVFSHGARTFDRESAVDEYIATR